MNEKIQPVVINIKVKVFKSCENRLGTREKILVNSQEKIQLFLKFIIYWAGPVFWVLYHN